MAKIDSYLDTIKKAENGESVRDAIALAINEVNKDGAITLIKGTFTSNGRKTPGAGTAYGEVVVNVEGGGTGYDTESFKVDVDTANGTYNAKDVIGDKKMWDTIVVDLPDDLSDDMGELVANEEKEYYPEDYGYSGFNKVTVQVSSTSEGPFTVQFKNKPGATPEILKTEIVPKNGTAICNNLDGSVLNGQYFVGWNPSPSNVTRDLICEPKYADIVITPPSDDEITDSWEVICSKKGAGYPIGSCKSLVVNPGDPNNTGANINCPNWTMQGNGKVFDFASKDGVTGNGGLISVRMRKVYEGESGSTSTWISDRTIQPPYYSPSNSGNNGGVPYNSMTMECERWGFYLTYIDWGISMVRHWMNNGLLQCLPNPLPSAIKTVEKVYTGHAAAGTRSTNSLIQKSSLDKLWVPSLKEVQTRLRAYPSYAGSALETYTETSGVDYFSLVGLYEKVSTPTGNPSENGYYELVNGVYTLSADTVVNPAKTYYIPIVFNGSKMFPYPGPFSGHTRILYRTCVVNAYDGYAWMDDTKATPTLGAGGSTTGNSELQPHQVLFGFCL